MKFKLLSENKNVSIGLILSYIALAISLIGSFLVTPIILNNIGDSNYGLFSFCNSITSWLSIISTALGSSFIFFVNKEMKETNTESKTNSIFVLSLSILSALIGVATLLSVIIVYFSGLSFSNYSTSENKMILALLLISGGNVAITVLFSAYRLFNNYKKSFVFVRGIQVIVSLLTYSLDLILAIYTKSIISIALVTFFASLFNGVLNLLYALKIRKMSFVSVKSFDAKQDFKRIVGYSSIILLSTIINNLDSNIDKTLLGLMTNSTNVAIYQLSISFIVHLNVVAYSFSEIMQPNIFFLIRNDRNDEANSLFLKISKLQSLIVLLIVGGYISCGYHFVIMWIGSERIMVYYYSLVLFVSCIIPLTLTSTIEFGRAKNKHKIPTVFGLCSSILNILLTIIFLLLLDGEFAIWSCIFGTIASRVIFSYIVNPIYYKKVLSLPIEKYYLNLSKELIFMVTAIIPGLLITFFLKGANIATVLKVLIEGMSFLIIYGVLLLLFERHFIKEILSKYFVRKKALDGNC